MRQRKGFQGCKNQSREKAPCLPLKSVGHLTSIFQSWRGWRGGGTCVPLRPAVWSSPSYVLPKELLLLSLPGNRNIYNIFHLGNLYANTLCSFSSIFFFLNFKVNVSIGVVSIKELDCTFSSCFLISKENDVNCRIEVILLNWLGEKCDKCCYFEEDTSHLFTSFGLCRKRLHSCHLLRII